MSRMDDSAPATTSETLPALPPVPLASRKIALLTVAMAVGAVLIFWFGGYLPWILDGFRTKDSALGDSGQGLGQLWLPIPLIAGQLAQLIAFTTVGAIAAMLLPLLFPAVPRALSVVVVALTLVTAAMSLSAVARSSLSNQDLDGFASDSRVLDGLVVGVLLLVLGCILVGALASLQVGFLPVAVAVAATQLPSWIGLLELPRAALVTEMLTVALLGAAFVVSIHRWIGWVITWPVALLILWLGPAISAAATAVSARLRPGQNLDMALNDVYAEGWEVFRAALGEAPRTWWPQLVAVLIGLIWLAVQRRRSREAR